LHVPPPAPPINWLAQKLSEPPSPPEKVQHRLLPPPAFAQSAALVQSWTCWLPEQENPSIVGQADCALQTAVSIPDVQLGGLPPVSGIVAQQACPPQFAGDMHPELEPPLLLPLLPPLPLPLLLPLLLLLAPLLLPLPLLLAPLLLPLPLLLVLPPLLPLDPPLLDPPPFELPLLPLLPPPPPVEVPSPLHAMSTSEPKTNTN
jgi:hypothetical protein